MTVPSTSIEAIGIGERTVFASLIDFVALNFKSNFHYAIHSNLIAYETKRYSTDSSANTDKCLRRQTERCFFGVLKSLLVIPYLIPRTPKLRATGTFYALSNENKTTLDGTKEYRRNLEGGNRFRRNQERDKGFEVRLQNRLGR